VVGAAYVLCLQACGLKHVLIVPREWEHAAFQEMGEY
ncbi:MAG: hypothetical protein ACI9FZ_000856, partial [Bacteroidia bacterium]